MLKQFAQKVEEMRRLIDDARSASFLLAVSGGMDSMCLLDMFSKCLQPSEYAVAHCNFSLRGEESDGDQALVETRAAELGTRIFVKRFDTKEYARERGISIEMAARDLRYSWFEELCSEHGFDVLAVAHNANDNAETLMLNLLRGTGLNGLHGMAETSACHPERGGGSVTLFRPLLTYTRKQIEGYVFTHRLQYRHDSSNFSSDYKRNRIRNEVFPVFEKINPSFVRTLNREVGYFAEAGSIVEEWCRMQLPTVLTNDVSDGNRVEISLQKLLATSHWRYLLYHILEPYGFNSQTLASVEELLTSDRTISGKRFESPTHTLLTTQDALICYRGQDYDVNERIRSQFGDIMAVRAPGIYNFNGTRFQVEIIEKAEDMPLRQPPGTLILDAGRLRFPFVCRRWRQGDWMIPLGMKGKKKISDLFTDLKYNMLEKDAAIIIVDTQTTDMADRQHVAGILGCRIDDSYKVASSTSTILRIKVL